MKRWCNPAAMTVAAVLGLNLALAGPAVASAARMSYADVHTAGGDHPPTAWDDISQQILWRHRGPILKCGFPLGAVQRTAVRVTVRRLTTYTAYARGASGGCATAWQIAKAVGKVIQIGLLQGNSFHVSDRSTKLTRPGLLPNRCDITIRVGRTEADAQTFTNHYYIC